MFTDSVSVRIRMLVTVSVTAVGLGLVMALRLAFGIRAGSGPPRDRKGSSPESGANTLED